MKKIFILRHAKSSWDYPDLADFQRPLNDRGKKTAPFMGAKMKERGLLPEFIFSSPAERARQTAVLVKDAAGIETEITYEHRIYEAGPNSLLHIIGEFDDQINSAMIIGHNPGFEGLVRILSDRSERMPTASLAVIDLDIASWSEIKPQCGKLVELLKPKELT